MCWTLVCALFLGQPEASPAEAAQPRPGRERVVLVATLDAGITSAVRDYLIGAIDEAEAVGATALVIRVDTPGGLLEATRELVRAILAAEVPVVVYVTPPGARAGSAGVFITLAAHVAAMAPATNIGAAHPVGAFGSDVQGEMARKVENDAAAWARSLALTRGRNPEWAEKAVRESAAIPAEEAVKAGVVDLLAVDLTALLGAVDGREVEVAGTRRRLETAGIAVRQVEMTGRQKLVKHLANPNLMYVMLLAGLFLIFLELKNPGLIVPGVVGVLLLALVLGVQILPVNWLGVLLILAAAALFILEIYVTSFGLLSAGALACLIVGSYLLFDVEGSTFRVDPAVIWSVALTFGALLLVVGYLLVRAKRQGPTSGVEAMAGEEAVVYERITPAEPGTVRARGAYWSASAGSELEPGERVRIVRVDGTKAIVEPLDPEKEGAP
jgi:membrane-bound serine protease (ClpP class)